MYRLDHAVTKKQRTILSAFGISEANVHKAAAEIGLLLKENKSLMDRMEEHEDGQEEEFELD